METLKLCFVLLLAQTVHSETREIHLKTTGKEPDVFQICTNETQNITVIVCKIRTEMGRVGECSLLYRREQGFTNTCDSRFTLITKNHTAFLHLTNLTLTDSGNYTCQCSWHGGTDSLYLNITVQDDEHNNNSPGPNKNLIILCASTAAVITVALVILGCIYRRLRHRNQRKALSSHLSQGSNPDIEPYSTFRRTESGLYSTVKLQDSQTKQSNVLNGEDKSFVEYSHVTCCSAEV